MRGRLVKWLSGSIVGGCLLFNTYYDETKRDTPSNIHFYQSPSKSKLQLCSILAPLEAIDFQDAIDTSCDRMYRGMALSGTPGASISVHVNGIPVMKSSYGYLDVENQKFFFEETSVRIASISKLITALIAMKLHQNEKFNINDTVAKLLTPNGFSLTFENEEKDVTTKQLMNHTAGIRHYLNSSEHTQDSELEEFYNTKKYPTVADGLQIFGHDNLLFSPGTGYTYTTYGYSLLSYILELVSNKSFEQLVSEFAVELGLKSLTFDEHEVIIPKRSRYYYKKDGQLLNSPYVDNSSKWAGGGMVSNADDLTTLGDIFLYCCQSTATDNYLSQESMSMILEFNPVTQSTKPSKESYYGLGIVVEDTIKRNGKEVQVRKFSHGGGAVGASSNIVIIPTADETIDESPRGITVTILSNLENDDVPKLAFEIGLLFRDALKNIEATREKQFLIELA